MKDVVALPEAGTSEGRGLASVAAASGRYLSKRFEGEACLHDRNRSAVCIFAAVSSKGCLPVSRRDREDAAVASGLQETAKPFANCVTGML